MNTDNFYCKIFLNAKISKKDLIRSVADTGKFFVENSSLSNHTIAIDIEDNEDFNSKVILEKKDEFLYYPYYLDVFKHESEDYLSYLGTLKDLIEHLRSIGFDVVAACDFEEDLNQ